MRGLVLTVLGSVLIAAGCASPGPTARPGTTAARDINWDARRPLAWSDFRGPADGNAATERVAMTAATLRWNYEYALEREASRCRYWIEQVGSEAVFNQADSWVRPGYLTDTILRHEQGHFDLTELYKRELDARTADLIGARATCSGATLDDAVAAAERGAAERVQAVFDAIWEMYTATQALYDRSTQHGTLADEQALWSRAISEALASGRWQPPH
jgi:hypothetical protein